MEYKLMERISEELRQNRRVALATLTRATGSTPAKEGTMMAVFEDGTTLGTIGGGKLEIVVTKTAQKSLESGESKSYEYKLNDDEGSLNMKCGGEAEVFIKVFINPTKLLVVGGGHIGFELYKLSNMLGFYTVVFDNRVEYCNAERFSMADELKPGDIEENLKNYIIDENTYIVIVTHGHKYDEIALKSVAGSKAKYIGVIGSRKKIDYILGTLENNKDLQNINPNIYAPVGLNLGGGTPGEIAFSIMSEILVIKNCGTLQHMRDVKK